MSTETRYLPGVVGGPPLPVPGATVTGIDHRSNSKATGEVIEITLVDDKAGGWTPRVRIRVESVQRKCENRNYPEVGRSMAVDEWQ